MDHLEIAAWLNDQSEESDNLFNSKSFHDWVTGWSDVHKTWIVCRKRRQSNVFRVRLKDCSGEGITTSFSSTYERTPI